MTWPASDGSTGRFASTGGIAQLVERQLCKLDVRGSNPLASMADQLKQGACSSVG